jgi:hypothetical protein
MVNIKDYINVREKTKELECQEPSSLALLPSNFETAKTKDEFHYESTAQTIRKLWRNNSIIETPIVTSGENFVSVNKKSFEWVSPVIFFSAAWLSQNPHLINIALNVISNYLTDWFRGLPKNEKIAKLDIVIEKENGEYKEIQYKGPPEGLKSLPKIIKETLNE